MTVTNELDSTCGISDEELTHRFRKAVRIDDEIRKKKGCQARDMISKPKGCITSILMEGESMSKDKNKLPEVMVFAGPNGSGKTILFCY